LGCEPVRAQPQRAGAFDFVPTFSNQSGGFSVRLTRQHKDFAMLLQPIDYFLIGWFLLAGLSTLYVGIDQNRNNPEPIVMKWGFILVTLYMGPFGLLLYVLADKEPRPGEHEAFTRPLWKKGLARPSIASPGMQPESSWQR
jgi:hypothetical protein